MSAPQLRYIDTHTHLDFPDFDHDRDQVLTDCRANGIVRLVVLGVQRDYWPRLWALCNRHPELYAAFGLHPVFSQLHQTEDLSALGDWLAQHASHPQCCAVGEIGLDYYIADADRAQQQQLFEAQLQLAVDFNLPVLLHVRRAHAATIATLKRYRLPRAGIVHAFAGSPEEAREYCRLGFKLGLGGAATWPQALRLRRTLADLPLDSLVLETDSPDMAPVFLAGQRNSPIAIPQICSELAALRSESPIQLANACLQNSCELFGWAADTVY